MGLAGSVKQAKLADEKILPVVPAPPPAAAG